MNHHHDKDQYTQEFEQRKNADTTKGIKEMELRRKIIVSMMTCDEQVNIMLSNKDLIVLQEKLILVCLTTRQSMDLFQIRLLCRTNKINT